MADEQDTSQEKTEEPTPKRLEKAKEDGQIARSKELNTFAILRAAAGGLILFGPQIGMVLTRIFSYNFALEREALFDPSMMLTHLGSSIAEAFLALAPLFFMLLVASILGPIALGGWILSAKAMAPKASRMSPLAGLKRMFSKKALMELPR